MNEWQRINPTNVTKVGWRTIVTKTFVMPNGEKASFDTFGPEGQEFVAVIGITPDNQVIIARQFRFGPEKMYDELPGGFVDTGEEAEAAAKREFLEETGHTPGLMEYIGLYHKDTYMNAAWHVFLARDCVKTHVQQLEDEEHIDVRLISIQELIYNAKSDKMTDAVAVLMAYDRLLEIDGKQ